MNTESRIQSPHGITKILRAFSPTLLLAMSSLPTAGAQTAIGTITRSSVPPPEPSTFAIFALGVLVLLLVRRTFSKSRTD